MTLDAAQRGVMRNMLLAFAVSLIVIVGVLLWQPGFLVTLIPVEARVASALRWDGLILTCLVIAIGNLARHRFFTPADIDGSGLTVGTDKARIYQAILQNTLEQTVVAVLAHLLWAATMPAAWFPAVPVAVALFVIGRICFAAGYSGGAAARAFGFALTFYPTAILTVAALAALVWRRIGG